MAASTAMTLQKERSLYLSMVNNAIAEEGPDSWQARLARTFLEDVEDDLLKVSLQSSLPGHDVRNFCLVGVANGHVFHQRNL